jgi:hypothetical protein
VGLLEELKIGTGPGARSTFFNGQLTGRVQHGALRQLYQFENDVVVEVGAVELGDVVIAPTPDGPGPYLPVSFGHSSKTRPISTQATPSGP